MFLEFIAYFTFFSIVLASVFWTAGLVLWYIKDKTQQIQILPSVSVIVAGRNEEKLISSCLESIAKINYPKDKLEPIFVDDHSTDRTLEIAAAVSAKYDNIIKILPAPSALTNIGPKKNALVYGISQSHGSILFFTDADNKVPSEWVSSTLGYYSDSKVGAVAGLALPNKKNLFYFLERLFVNYTTLSNLGWGSPASVCGQNFSFRRAAFDQLQQYPYSEIPSGDDDLMAQAIYKNGWKVKFCASPLSAVEDLRPPTYHSEINSAIRHQSTVKFYPWYWRLAYLFSISSNLLLLIFGILTIFYHGLFSFFTLTILLKTTLDGIGFLMLKHKLKISLNLFDLIISELILPFYLILKSALLLLPSYQWKRRSHSMSTLS